MQRLIVLNKRELMTYKNKKKSQIIYFTLIETKYDYVLY